VILLCWTVSAVSLLCCTVSTVGGGAVVAVCAGAASAVGVGAEGAVCVVAGSVVAVRAVGAARVLRAVASLFQQRALPVVGVGGAAVVSVVVGAGWIGATVVGSFRWLLGSRRRY
jgi:hypothetical protein